LDVAGELGGPKENEKKIVVGSYSGTPGGIVKGQCICGTR